MKRTFDQHLDPSILPKRILSLSGGGIRGALSLGYLKKIETILREKTDDSTLLLCDYFDLIGGTSTGSIIAAALAIGKEVDEITELYLDLGAEIFGDRRRWWNPLETMQYLRARYDYAALENYLKKTFGNINLDSQEIRTGLCIVAKRADTNSTWPIINHPKGKFYDSSLGKNKNIPLWQAVRASSAAPTYFAPQMIDVGGGERAAFVDGGLSMANNPSLTILMVATLKGFPFRWEMGEEKLTLISVGTGYGIFKKQTGEIEDAWLLNWANNVPSMFMQDADWQNRTILQWLSNSPTSEEIDTEMGDLKADFIGGKPMIKYLNYDTPITENNLNALNLGRSFTSKDVEDLLEMSNAKNKELLYEIGSKASSSVLDSHFD